MMASSLVTDTFGGNGGSRLKRFHAWGMGRPRGTKMGRPRGTNKLGNKKMARASGYGMLAGMAGMAAGGLMSTSDNEDTQF